MLKCKRCDQLRQTGAHHPHSYKCRQSTLTGATYIHAIGLQVFNNKKQTLHTKVYVHGNVLNCIAVYGDDLTWFIFYF